jgi:hypothetical protein
MPVACNSFSPPTLRWDRFERFLAGLSDLSEADRQVLLQQARCYGAGDLRAFGVPSGELRRLRLDRAIREGARQDLAGRPQSNELFDRMRRYARRAYARDQKVGTPSPGNVVEYYILEIAGGTVPSSEYIRKVLRP